ncbi:hydrolase [Campylobacterota bacterium]|nr:hydrolase [Campylobacterota bacterium]
MDLKSCIASGVGLAIAGVLGGCAELGHIPVEKDFAKYEHIPYFKDGVFQASETLVFNSDRVRGGKAGMMMRLLTSSFVNAHAPKSKIPLIQLDKSSFAAPHNDLAAYWLGHSMVIIEIEGKRILVDPVFDNAAPVPFVVPRFTAAPIKRSEIPDVDYVLITHDHYDHLEYATMRFLRDRDTRFIAPYGVDDHLRKWGIADEKITTLGWGDTHYDADANLTIGAERTLHFSGRTLRSRSQTLWVSYAIIGANRRVFVSGDSGYAEHYKAIGEKYNSFDLAFIEIDGWNPGWENTHLFPQGVIAAYRDINASAFMPVHWGVFDLAIHPWKESITMIDELLEDDMKMVTPMMGEKFIYGETETRKWYMDIE